MKARESWILVGAFALAAAGCNSILGLDRDYKEQDCPFADSCPDASNDATVASDGSADADASHTADGRADGPITMTDADAGPQGEDGCAAGSLACDGGCIPNDPHNCGACGHDCTILPNVSGQVACGADGTCEFDAAACTPSYAHCGDGGLNQGCETPIDTTSNCGGCGTTCGTTVPYCSGSGGAYSCTSGCTGSMQVCGDGGTCIDTTSNAANCKTCGNVCTTQDPHATPQCVNSVCTAPCNQGTRMCPSGLCAANDTSACGPSCTQCVGPTGGSVSCDGMKCVPSCPMGQHACNGACLSDSDAPSTDACVITEAYGVFAAPTGSDSSGDGTRAHPYATIGHAIGAAGTKRVYACGGNYAESLSVGSSAAAYGGLNCSTWAYDGSKAAVAPPSPGYALRVTGNNVTFEDFGFTSQPAVGAGASSIAVFVSSVANVVFRRCQATAGSPVQGADQTQPAPFGGAAPGGIAPAIGMAGASVPNPQCSSVGGAGGSDTGQYSGFSGTRSTPYTQNGAVCGNVACTGGAVGGSGSNGSPGSTGMGAQSWASFATGGWSPTAGQPGGAGEDGQGGGGGGYTVLAHSDVWGGSGGAGGCAGAPGAGGGGGGSSIALLAYNSAVDLESCVLAASAAGRGGNGAAGQQGQAGGAQGGTSATNYGGQGGNGGGGGPGGGGAGGLSGGVVWWGMQPTVNGGSQTTGTPGAAGAGGGQGNGGKAGTAGSVIQFQ